MQKKQDTNDKLTLSWTNMQPLDRSPRRQPSRASKPEIHCWVNAVIGKILAKDVWNKGKSMNLIGIRDVPHDDDIATDDFEARV